ncbi:hypothetical protein [Streptomyces niveus]|uniref:hypothetical protein n=1 Tax=Streptomyces niveus TaxID=193462 RepID=UPI0003C5CFA2|nr:hypothetical protein [Streptomyces niveus]EST30968.1 hypothetical protein M877_08595 [Streptomyces niveus NCIMB 11891]
MSSKESTEIAETETAEPESEATAGTGTAGAEPADGSRDKDTGSRAGIAIATAVLLACGGLVGYGFLNTEEKPKPRAVPTAEVTYEVTGEGTVEVSYLARSESGSATVVKDAALPWKKTVRVPLGQDPTVAIVLGEKGGQAACTLAVHGTHVQRATASGTYGRATCNGQLPRP